MSVAVAGVCVPIDNTTHSVHIDGHNKFQYTQNTHILYQVQSNRNYAYWFLSFVALLPPPLVLLVLLLMLVTRSPHIALCNSVVVVVIVVVVERFIHFPFSHSFAYFFENE